MPSSLVTPTVNRLLQWKTLLFLFCLLLAACNTLEPALDLSAQQNSELLRLSKRADRTKSEVVGSYALSESVYIFATPPKTVKEVRFHLDGKLVRSEQQAPFDLMGGTLRQAKPFDTTQLDDGTYTLSATFKHKNGRQTRVQNIFTVNNAVRTAPEPVAPTPPSLPAPDTPTAPPVRWQPKPGTSWQWQLQGPIDLSLAVDVYDIDLFDTPASTVQALQQSGKHVICYFSAGSFEPWRSDAAAFSAAVKGIKMDGWDELWLDIRALEQLGPIMRARLDLAAQKGCDGVEPDNVDGYSNNSGFPLSAANQLAYNRFLATEAHARGLAIGLKNDLEQVKELEPYFDFAINEECFTYNECELLSPFVKAGKAVFGAEYSVSTQRFCPLTNSLNFDFIKKRYSLDAYREACR